MAIETPATILFIGAGPVALEAALYARYRGYHVEILEAGQVCEHVHHWSHVKMFSPFSMNHSPLGKAAIESHEPNHLFPATDEYITGAQWLASYLLPLSETDLLRPSIHTNSRVVSVSRTWSNKTDLTHDRAGDPFRVIVEQEKQQRVLTADIVIDTSGVYANPNPIGAGGIPAIGEKELVSDIKRSIPTIEQAHQLSGQQVAVIGAGHSAASTLITLSNAGANLTWITRGDHLAALQQIEDDPLAERVHILKKLQSLVANSEISVLPNCAIDTVKLSESESCQKYKLGIYETRKHAPQEEGDNELKLTWHSFDQIFGLTGYRTDSSIHQELQVHQCYATEGPIQLAASLLSQSRGNCLDLSIESRELLITTEPNYYQLGIKSYGRQSGFLFHTGLNQIVQLFQIIGDRDSLDIYQTFSG